jgi:type I restriction-modification system DNA methylase subunit
MPSDEKPTVPKTILDLVERFERNREAYKSGNYNETQVRREFLDPFFKALGWDIDNEQGYAEDYKDVIHKDTIKTADGTKAPDYCFRIGGARKFFLEGKRPSVDIKNDVSPAFQLRRYGFTTKLPLSILSDFEEFAVYDCRFKPDKNDSAAVGRILYIHYTEYATRWHEIAGVFSREAVLKGSFDKFAESSKAKRGTADVDDAFLETIETWRKELAQNLALRNKQLSQRELNFAVQRIIDRIIFLRICEGRGIEDYGRLRALADGDKIYPRLGKLFEQADDRYNSGLFHFRAEKDRHEAPDELTLKLDLDDKLLRDILKNLYYPDSPYVFSALSADVLGQVYEQFLGKVIRLTPAHRAEVDDKPEVKKAGGVFYTPTYIVEYIVQNTVGKLLEGKTPKLAAKLKILDPACGSGSFLLGAYEHLLKWHRDFYTQNEPAKWAKGSQPVLVQTSGGSWKLTISERKRILLDNIYGVDIDAQAVETTKLSLLLKVLEGETSETIQPELLHERALPDLDNNIKCGNSLIGPDFYQQQQMTLLDEEERYRVNVFDWHAEFPQVFPRQSSGDELRETPPGIFDYTMPGVPLHGSFSKISYKKKKSKKTAPPALIESEGGFDAVIGNPPYVDIKGLPEIDVEYIFGKFPTANNRINLFATFLEQSLDLCKQSDFRVSMIVPTALLTQESYRELRKQIIAKFQIASVVRLPNESFGSAAGDVKVDTVIVTFGQRLRTQRAIEIISYAGYDRINKIDPSTAHVHTKIPQERWSASKNFVWSLNTSSAAESILEKCENQTVPLEDCAEVCLGLTPYDKYKGHTESQIKNRIFHAESKKDKTFKRLLAGNDVTRYGVRWNGEEWISYGPWLGAPREQKFFTEKRILVKQIIDWTTKRIWAGITDEELYNTQNAFNLLPKEGWQLEYLLGILNSRLMTFYHQKKFLDEFKMRFQKILIKDCRRFPIRVINKADKSRHDQMVNLVEQMLALHQSLAAAKTPPEQTALERQITVTDTQIDRLVYDLYGLTDEEIKIVEEAK